MLKFIVSLTTKDVAEGYYKANTQKDKFLSVIFLVANVKLECTLLYHSRCQLF